MTDTFDQPVTIYDLQGREDAKINLRRMPNLVRRASQLVLAAGKREFIISTSLQIVSALVIGVQLIVGRGALQELFEAERSGAD